MVRQYLTSLDSALESHPELQGCAVFCRHCGIRFLTHPRNAGRQDLRCPFGCREHHQRQSSQQRSAAYYRTAAGQGKKKRLNARRARPPRSPGEPAPAALDPQTPPLPESVPQELPVPVPVRLEEVVLDESQLRNSPLLPYVGTVVNLLEGRQLNCQQVVEVLVQALRQRSIARRNRADYVREDQHQYPP